MLSQSQSDKRLARLIVYELDSDHKVDACILSDEKRIQLTRAYATAEDQKDDVQLQLRYLSADVGNELARLLLKPYVFAILYYDEQILFDVPCLITTVSGTTSSFTITLGLHQG